MFNKLLITLTLAASTLGVAGTAQAVTLTPGEAEGFEFGDVGSTTDPSAFIFTVGEAGADLQVGDAGFAGDSFQVFNFGESIGTTSQVATDDTVFIATADEAFNNPLFSSGTFPLTEGDQNITLTPITSPFGEGTGFVRFDPRDVPEPLTIVGSMVAIGMGAMLKREYSRQKNLAK